MEGLLMRRKCNICMKGNVTTVWARAKSCNIQKDKIVKHNNNSTKHKDEENKIGFD